MDPILRLAKKYKIDIIEDAACGFGSFYKGKHVGNFGSAGCFSFHPRKSITTGEGGMITAKNKSLIKKLSSLRDHGASISDHQRHKGNKPYLLPDFSYAGYNQRMTDIQAALGLEQMKRAHKILKERRKLAAIYNDELKNNTLLKIPYVPKNFSHGYQSYPCIFGFDDLTIKNVKKINKKEIGLWNNYKNAGISTRPATHAVHMLDFYHKNIL